MLTILLCTLAVAADDKPAAKEPPRILVASIKEGKLVSRQTVTVAVPVTVIKKEQQGDKVVDVAYTVIKTETREIDQSFDLKKATFSTAGGKKLDLDAVKKKLAKPQPIVVSGDGKAIDESFLKLFDKDVIVIVMPLPVAETAPVVPVKPDDLPPPPKPIDP